MKTIEITVSPTGETTLQTKGFAGASCKGASKPYEEALGVTTADTPTAEARLPEKNARRQQQGN